MKYILILISVCLGSVAQFLFKTGMNVLNIKEEKGLNTIIHILLNKYIVSGLFLYGVSVLVWFFVLSQFELSKAYPFVSLGYLITLFLGYFFLGESLSYFKVAGILLICAGVVVLARG